MGGISGVSSPMATTYAAVQAVAVKPQVQAPQVTTPAPSGG
jgi:hypothetical protein